MPNIRALLATSCLLFFFGCTGLNGPATVSDMEVHTTPKTIPADVYSPAAVYLQTETHIYEVVRIEQMLNDTIAITPFPFWNIESKYVCIDDIISVSIPRNNDPVKGFCIGFSLGFSVFGIMGLATSEYDRDYYIPNRIN